MGDFNMFNENDFIPKNSNSSDSTSIKMKSNDKKKQMKDLLTSDSYRPMQTTDGINLIKNVFKWKDSFEMANMIPISYTNWTGIRVDYIFFTNDWNENDVVFSRTYFSNESDHIPIICDILDEFYLKNTHNIDYFDNDLRTSEDDKKTSIEILSYKNKQNEQPKIISHDEFLVCYNKHMNNVKNKSMSFGGQIENVKTINDIFLYNGQTSNNINWFELEPILKPNKKYEYKDPTMTSSEPKQINLGGNGLYATDSVDFALNYAVDFTHKEVNKGSYPIIFIFKLLLDDDDIKNIKIGMVNYRLITRNFEEEFDNKHDIMFLNERQYQHLGIQIKFTKKFFRDFTDKMILIKILNLGDPKYNSVYYENPKFYTLPKQKIFDLQNLHFIYKYLDNQYKEYDINALNNIITSDAESGKLQNKVNHYINKHQNNMIGGCNYYLKWMKYMNKNIILHKQLNKYI
jgi:hypothetical protein